MTDGIAVGLGFGVLILSQVPANARLGLLAITCIGKLPNGLVRVTAGAVEVDGRRVREGLDLNLDRERVETPP